MKKTIGMISVWTIFLILIIPGAGWCNRPPDDFELVWPPDGEQNLSIPFILDWDAAGDPDGDVVTYTVTISENENFTDADVYPDLDHTSFPITADNDLKADVPYYWKVLAIDGQGAVKTSDVRFFFPSTNEGNVIFNGHVYDQETGKPIPYATLVSGNITIEAESDGFYEEAIPHADKITFIVDADCYVRNAFEIERVPVGATSVNDYPLTPDAKGDVDGQNCITLADAVMVLRMLAGEDGTVDLEADVDGDSEIGLAEAIFIMATMAQ